MYLKQSKTNFYGMIELGAAAARHVRARVLFLRDMTLRALSSLYLKQNVVRALRCWPYNRWAVLLVLLLSVKQW